MAACPVLAKHNHWRGPRAGGRAPADHRPGQPGRQVFKLVRAPAGGEAGLGQRTGQISF